MKNIPQKIYLQTGHKNPVTDFKMLSTDDITWSSTRENDTDIEYDLSNHSVLHNIIERSLPTLPEINKAAKDFERYKDTMSEAGAHESVGRYWGFKEGVDWMKKRMTSL